MLRARGSGYRAINAHVRSTAEECTCSRSGMRPGEDPTRSQLDQTGLLAGVV